MSNLCAGATDRRKRTAEELTFDAIAADMSEWIVYKPGENLNKWLENNRPSKVAREDNIGWIAIYSKLKADDVLADTERLQREWAAMINELKDPSSGRIDDDNYGTGEAKCKLDFQSIMKLAKNCHVLTGKWLFHAPTGYKVDLLWRIICEEMVGTGVLANAATSAKVSPTVQSDGPSSTHVICVYVRDYSNFEEVCGLERALRAAGIKKELRFKPDVYTCLGIYAHNDWGIRPTIYLSHYDVVTKTSTVTRADLK